MILLREKKTKHIHFHLLTNLTTLKHFPLVKMSQALKRAVKQINVMKEEKLIVPLAHTKMTQEHKTEHPI